MIAHVYETIALGVGIPGNYIEWISFFRSHIMAIPPCYQAALTGGIR